MASGQQIAQQNLESFILWESTQANDDFTQLIHRGQLNRGEARIQIISAPLMVNWG